MRLTAKDVERVLRGIGVRDGWGHSDLDGEHLTMWFGARGPGLFSVDPETALLAILVRDLDPVTRVCEGCGGKGWFWWDGEDAHPPGEVMCTRCIDPSNMSTGRIQVSATRLVCEAAPKPDIDRVDEHGPNGEIICASGDVAACEQLAVKADALHEAGDRRGEWLALWLSGAPCGTCKGRRGYKVRHPDLIGGPAQPSALAHGDSGWNLQPTTFEFWLHGASAIRPGGLLDIHDHRCVVEDVRVTTRSPVDTVVGDFSRAIAVGVAEPDVTTRVHARAIGIPSNDGTTVIVGPCPACGGAGTAIAAHHEAMLAACEPSDPDDECDVCDLEVFTDHETLTPMVRRGHGWLRTRGTDSAARLRPNAHGVLVAVVPCPACGGDR